MSKEIDQLDLSTALEIDKWLVPSFSKQDIASGSTVKARVRNYLRNNKLSPYDALERIRKEKACMPKNAF